MKESVLISSVESNRQLLDGGSMFGNAPRAVWQKWIAPDERDRIPLACRCLLIEIDGKKILCEAGIGSFFEPKLADRFGVQEPARHMLLENLGALNVKEEDIDIVILSHLHFDHAGGLLPPYSERAAGKDRLLFPNAQFVVGKDAWERATHPHFRDQASFVPEINQFLKDSGRLKLIDRKNPEKLLGGKIEFRFSDGHTPGQMHTLCHGENQTVFYAGDLIPGLPWIHLPITMGYDRYPEKLIDEKSELYELAQPQHWLIFFTHDPETSAAVVDKDDKGRYFAKEKINSLNRMTL